MSGMGIDHSTNNGEIQGISSIVRQTEDLVLSDATEKAIKEASTLVYFTSRNGIDPSVLLGRSKYEGLLSAGHNDKAHRSSRQSAD
ncbi:unnamed protein product [Dovyalis caffra]|uniref:Uncharacterized protein n=1 Tax=Dovyalis caffra TaxID=77055 RepID=A0AAV1S807_9ROSI|nr:unnamed protein product [Dovyalis caffra]